jgi:hypothetical protein
MLLPDVLILNFDESEMQCDREHTYALNVSCQFATGLGEDTKPSLEKWQPEPLQDLQHGQLVEMDTRMRVVQPGRMYVARQCATFACSTMRPIQLADFGATEDEPAVKLQRDAAACRAAEQRAAEKTQRAGEKKTRVAEFISGTQRETTKKAYDAIQARRQVRVCLVIPNHWHQLTTRAGHHRKKEEEVVARTGGAGRRE